jgi:tRNA U34 2-thiouridine synthase MnmA/TrmU
MSGGVDSSVAAALLQQSRFDVIGAHIVCWDGCELKQERRETTGKTNDRVSIEVEPCILSLARNVQSQISDLIFGI